MDKKEMLKAFIKRLHEGEDPEAIKVEFREAFADASSADIAAAEEQLIKEGMPLEEIHSLCDVHLAAFKDVLEKEGDIAPQGHPVHTLMTEHSKLLDFAEKLIQCSADLKNFDNYDAAGEVMGTINHLIEHFKESEKHYFREENVLFPSLEKHGITGPPKVMWMEHESIRGLKKKLYPHVDNAADIPLHDFAVQLETYAKSLQELLSGHFYKENNILFPAAMQALSESEWKDVSGQFDEIGYCCFSPKVAEVAEKGSGDLPAPSEGEIPFETGTLPPQVIEAMFNTLPVEITFIDAEDTVKYFSQSKDKIFTRSKAIIGTKVQNCHPQKSVHLVNRILDDFKSGKRDVAEFWIDMNEKKVYIRYFAVRNREGKYLGCMEVTQDIAPIQKIEGQKRLLD